MEVLLAALVSPIGDLAKAIWSSIANHEEYMYELQRDLESLESEMERLQQKKMEVERRVTRQESRWMQRTHEVTDWLNRIDRMEKNVERIKMEGRAEIEKRRIRGVSSMFRYCCSSNKAGMEVSWVLQAVIELINQGQFDVLVQRKPPELVDERPVDITVGMDAKFDEVWRWLEDPSVGIIGLYGMGGVGKTTLLRRLNNKLLNRRHSFQVVIWAVASKKLNREKIQEVICTKLEIPEYVWRYSNEDDRAVEILKVLRRKRFLLLLDDLWEKLDLVKLGIPLPGKQNGSKVVFTTRSEEVCEMMNAHRSKMEPLSPKDALQLFREKVGEETFNSHSEIPKLAETVARECKGLPLALVTIGQAMASRRGLREWKHAVNVLKSCPSKFSGMRNEVFPVLKFSYDNLSNDTLKMCFLFCSVFPEDHNIRKDELIELWIAEGILNHFDSIYDARNEGEYIVGSLKLACLLECGDLEDWSSFDYEPEKYVRMHDLIRDMALWLASENGEKEKKAADKSAEQNGVVRMTMSGPSYKSLSQITVSPCLQTLFIRGTKLKTFPSGFFNSLQSLRVLNLSGNNAFTTLPADIGELNNLQYLNLSFTSIEELPIEIKNLKSLVFLLLDRTELLRIIPRNVISSLSSLQVFSKLAFVSSQSQPIDGSILLQELESLEHIEDISITLRTLNSIQKLLNSPKLQGCIRQVLLGSPGLSSLTISSSSVRRMEHLERLELKECASLKELRIHIENNQRIQDYSPEPIAGSCKISKHEYFHNLCHVEIWRCSIMLNLSWLVHAPQLETLSVSECNSMVEIIGDDFRSRKAKEDLGLFSNLRRLYLFHLPMLQVIYRKALPFPSLGKIAVSFCPSLRNLPFSSSTASNSLKAIEGDRSWWEDLQWEDETLKHIFSSKFKELDPI